jgi:hypothetical protein
MSIPASRLRALVENVQALMLQKNSTSPFHCKPVRELCKPFALALKMPYDDIPS